MLIHYILDSFKLVKQNLNIKVQIHKFRIILSYQIRIKRFHKLKYFWLQRRFNRCCSFRTAIRRQFSARPSASIHKLLKHLLFIRSFQQFFLLPLILQHFSQLNLMLNFPTLLQVKILNHFINTNLHRNLILLQRCQLLLFTLLH